MPSEIPNDLILFHYSFSPYARRIVWYLTLRGISYAECIQPHVLPRPDLQRLGVQYRRIPLLSHQRSIYADTRLMLSKLETLFPASSFPSPNFSSSSSTTTTPEHTALRRLLSYWIIDGGIFARASQLMPISGAIVKDEKFLRDRSELTGRTWSKENFERQRPEALQYIRQGFELLEALLADGREWILKTGAPSLTDIEAVWPFDWLIGMPGALPQELISATQFPKVFAWVGRFRAKVKEGKKKPGLCKRIKGDEAADYILGSRAPDAENNAVVDSDDPLGLKKGEQVKVYPVDSGSKHRDTGELVRLTRDEVVIKLRARQEEVVYFHAPRWGYRVQRVGGDARL